MGRGALIVKMGGMIMVRIDNGEGGLTMERGGLTMGRVDNEEGINNGEREVGDRREG